MREPETGRGSEQCQQIREVQKPPQEACQSSFITRASVTQWKTWELQTVQECHSSQQRVQIKPWEYVLFYSGYTSVVKAIHWVKVSTYNIDPCIKEQVIQLEPSTFPLSTCALCFPASSQTQSIFRNAREVSHLQENLPWTKQQQGLGGTTDILQHTSSKSWVRVNLISDSVNVIFGLHLGANIKFSQYVQGFYEHIWSL